MADANARINIDINTSAAAAGLRQLQSQITAFNSTLTKSSAVQATALRNSTQNMLELVNASRFFTAETVRMQTAAASLDKTLSKGQVTIGQFFGARFRKDSLAAAQVMSLANTRAAALQTQFVATGAAANGMRDAIAIRPLQAFNNAAVVSAQKLAIHRAMLQQATTQMINFGKNTQWAGRQLMVGFTVPLTIFAGVAGKTFRDLEREAVNFRKVYGDAFTPPEEMEQNLQAVQELAKEYTKYGIAVKDTIGLAAEAAAAGAQNKDLLDATAQATRLATLGQMQQNEALETTISLQNAFKLSGDDLAKSINFLNMVENQTVVTLQDLSAAIPRVAPVIKGLGGSIEDLAAFMAALQEGGVTAEQGANALKSGLASLINPTDRAKEKLDSLGISLDSIIQMNRGDLMGTVQDFATALDTLDEFTRQQALEEVFGKFQYARLGALFANINKDGTQAARVLEMTGMSAAEMAASAEKELGAIEEAIGTKFTAAMEKLQLAIAPIGELFTKMAIPVVNFFTSILDRFNNLPDFAKTFTAFASVIVGIVIPTGTMFLGLLMNLIGTLVKFGALVGTAFKGFTSGGFKGAFDAVSQSLKFMSLAEMDAVNSAQQLAGSTEAVNIAFRDQVGASESAQSAVMELAYAYEILTQQMREAAIQNELVFGVGAAAMGATGTRGPRIRRNRGGTIPGSGNTDTVPAMLTPGEFVVNKQATQDNLGLLRQINAGGKVPGFSIGGLLALTGAAVRSRGLLGSSAISLPVSGRPLAQTASIAKRYEGAYAQAHMTERKRITLPSPFNPNSQAADDWLLARIPGKTKKARMARELARKGLIGSSLSNDTVSMPTIINNAARTRSTQPLTLSQAADILELSGSVKIGPNSAMALAGFPIGNNDQLGRGIATELRKIAIINGDIQLTDALLTAARNSAIGNTRLSSVRSSTTYPYAGIMQSTELQNYLGIDNLVDLQAANAALQAKGYSGIRLIEKSRPSGKVRIELVDKSGNTIIEEVSSQDKIKFNRGNIVPGQGNKDTVPAMLTPGEFVVNKKATQSNIELLRAINDGTIRGYAAGDIVGDKRNGFYAEGTNGMRSGPFPTRRMARKEAKQIIDTLGISRRGGMGGMRGMGMGMGMGMLGGAMFMGAGMMPNQGATTAMQAGGTVLSIASMLPFLGVGGPVTLALAGIAAAAAGAGLAIKAWRESVDSAARKAAEFGANLGGTANTLNTIAQITGQQTPLQRRAQVQLGLTNKDIENIMSPEMTAILSSEKGQALIEELKSVTSAERFQKLADYLKSAIASGLMDRSMAESFAKAVSFELNDALLSSKVVKIISGQGTGARAMMGIAEQRSSAANDLFTRLEDEFATAAEQVSAGYTQTVRIGGDTPMQVIGVAIQGLQDYANVQALAQEELANGIITSQEFAKINEEVIKQQNRFSQALEASIKYAADSGAVMQATMDQLINAGIVTEEQFKSLEGAAKVSATQDISVAKAIEMSESLESAGVAALAMGTDIVSVNAALRDLADTATGGTNAMRVAFDALGRIDYAIAETQIMGLIGGQAPGREAATREQLRGFITGGGDTAGLQAMLGTMSPQEAASTMGIFGQLGDVATQNKFISDFQNLTSTVGTEFARQITMSDQYLSQLEKGQTTFIDTLNEAANIFGEKTQDMLEYANRSGTEIQMLTKWAKDLQSIPQEATFKLGIDITSPKDLEKFGPIADSIESSWPVLSKLPEEIDLKAFVNANIKENGQLLDSEKLANKVIQIKKAMADLDSTKPEIVKNASVNIMVAEGMTMTDAKTAFENIISGMEDFNNFEVQDKIFVIQAAVDLYGAIKALEALQQVNSGDLDGGIRALRIAQEQNVQRAQARVTGAEQAGRINISGTGRGGGGGGGGQPEKTIIEELREQFSALKTEYDAMSRFINSKTGQFKGIISGPFAPEFIEYLKSQGERGLAVLKGGLDKIKAVYAEYKRVQIQELANFTQTLPATLMEQAKVVSAETSIARKLIDANFPPEIADMIAEKFATAIASGNKKAINMLNKIIKIGPEAAQALSNAQIDLNLDEQERELESIENILRAIPGASQETISALISLGINSGSSAAKIKEAASSLDTLAARAYAAQPALVKLSNSLSAQANALQSQLSFNQYTVIAPMEDALAALQMQLSGLDRAIEMKQRSIRAIQREIELEERLKEPIEDRIEELEEEQRIVDENYDNTIQSLEKVERLNERIARQRQGRLDVASALSRGDVAAAAQAALDMQRSMAELRQEETREGIDASFDEQRKAIEEAIRQEREKIAEIDERIEQKQLSIRAIQDEIFEIESQRLALQDAIFQKQMELEAARRRQLEIEKQIARIQMAQSVVETQQQILTAARNRDEAGVRFGLESLKFQAGIMEFDPQGFASIEGIQPLLESTNQLLAAAETNAQNVSAMFANVLSILGGQAEGEGGQAEGTGIEKGAQDMVDTVSNASSILKGEDAEGEGEGGKGKKGKGKNKDKATGLEQGAQDMVDTMDQSVTELQKLTGGGESEDEGILPTGVAVIDEQMTVVEEDFKELPEISAKIVNHMSAAEQALKDIATKISSIQIPSSIGGGRTQTPMYGGVIKRAFGGMIGYRGSREQAPGMMMGGKVKKFAFGSIVPGIGMTDKVPALLTPGEFVVRKSVARTMLPELKAMNSQVYPGMGVPKLRSTQISSPQFDTMKKISTDTVKFGIPQNINSYLYPSISNMISQTNMDSNPINTVVGPTTVQYNYNLNVSAKTNASAEEIANTVMHKIKRFDDRKIRGTQVG